MRSIRIASPNGEANTTRLAKRPYIAPNLPTIAEAAGLPDFEVSVWFGLMAPAGTPRSIIDKLGAAANAALKSEHIVTQLSAQVFEPLGSTPEEFTQLIARDTSKWTAVAQVAGLKK